MINVNLLPDSKLQGLKDKRSKQLVKSISMLLIIASVAVPIVFLIFDFIMMQAIGSKQDKIDDLVTKFETEQDVQRMLTVQSQLTALPEVELNSFKMSNLLAVIEQSTPKDVRLVGVSALNDKGTFEFQVSAGSMQSANEFIDTLNSIKIVSAKEGGDDSESLAPGSSSESVSPFSGPVTTSLSSGASEPITFSVRGKLNTHFGKIDKIDKFILKPFKLELIPPAENAANPPEDN